MRVAVYVHIPFCVQRCTYCDFNSYAGLLHLRPTYTAALKYEIQLWAERYRNLQATSLYFGGGTPSLLTLENIPVALNTLRRHLNLSPEAEVTFEANPGTLGLENLAALRQAGVNRLSLGIQSAHDDELLMLGRIHNWADAVQAVSLVRQTGFKNLSLDLIYGLPGQTLARWLQTLDKVLALGPQHLSLYALTLEPGTPLAEAVATGELPAPDSDLSADMYEAAAARLQQAGFWQYEISNWARAEALFPEAEWAPPPQGKTEMMSPWVCQHNLIYWRNTPWLGLGAGAHSWFRQQRWSNLRHPHSYIQTLNESRLPGIEHEFISLSLEMGETLMMGLRLCEGVTETRFKRRFGVGLEEVFGETLARLSKVGLLSWDGTCVRLTSRGRLLGNQVFGEFLP